MLAHVAGHFHAPHDGAGKQALADGPRPPPPAFGPVRGVAAAEIVPLHHPFKSAPFGDADRIHKIALRKNGGPDNIAGFDRQGKIAELAHPLGGQGAVFFEMAQQRLGHALLFLVVKTKLDGVVAVGRDRFGLDDAVGAGLDDGDRTQGPPARYTRWSGRAFFLIIQA